MNEDIQSTVFYSKLLLTYFDCFNKVFQALSDPGFPSVTGKGGWGAMLINR